MAESPTLRIVALETERERDSWRKAHEADTTLSWIVKAKTGNNSRPEWTTMRAAAPAIKQFWLLWDQLEMKNGILCKRWDSDDGRIVRHLLVTPRSHREEVVSDVHGGRPEDIWVRPKPWQKCARGSTGLV